LVGTAHSLLVSLKTRLVIGAGFGPPFPFFSLRPFFVGHQWSSLLASECDPGDFRPQGNVFRRTISGLFFLWFSSNSFLLSERHGRVASLHKLFRVIDSLLLRLPFALVDILFFHCLFTPLLRSSGREGFSTPSVAPLSSAFPNRTVHGTPLQGFLFRSQCSCLFTFFASWGLFGRPLAFPSVDPIALLKLIFFSCRNLLSTPPCFFPPAPDGPTQSKRQRSTVTSHLFFQLSLTGRFAVGLFSPCFTSSSIGTFFSNVSNPSLGARRALSECLNIPALHVPPFSLLGSAFWPEAHVPNLPSVVPNLLLFQFPPAPPHHRLSFLFFSRRQTCRPAHALFFFLLFRLCPLFSSWPCRFFFLAP